MSEHFAVESVVGDEPAASYNAAPTQQHRVVLDRAPKDDPESSTRTLLSAGWELDYWPAAYTNDLIDLLNVVGLLIDQHPVQQQTLDDVLAGPLLGRSELHAAGVLPVPDAARQPPRESAAGDQLALGT